MGTMMPPRVTSFLKLVLAGQQDLVLSEDAKYEAARFASLPCPIIVLICTPAPEGDALPSNSETDIFVLKGIDYARQYLNGEIDSFPVEIQSFLTHDRELAKRLNHQMMRHNGTIHLVH